MRSTNRLVPLLLIALAGCASSSTTLTPTPKTTATLPPPSTGGSVPASIIPAAGYKVSVFAEGGASTKPDSLVQIGSHVFVGFGDTVNPDGTPGPGGVAQTEVREFDLSGKLQKTYEVVGHNDGLMAFDRNTLWAMSNEDANPKLVVIDIASGAQRTYSAAPSLLNGSGGLAHGGGIDDMQIVKGNVYVSGSNPTASTSASCAANTSTPGCPNGVSTGPYVYAMTLGGSATFNLTPIVSSNAPATNRATNASATINMTDPDSEVVAPDGSTLIVDGQQDAELAFVSNLTATPSVSYLPLTFSGAPQQVDDTRFAPSGATFLLLADTPSNAIYRIDGAFTKDRAYSAGQTALLQLDTNSGLMTSVVRGFAAPHGLLFVSPP